MPRGEPLVLEGEGLKSFRQEIASWRKTLDRHLRVDMTVFFGWQQWLAQETGIETRQISRILKEYTQVKYSDAEKILFALGVHYKLDNGEIELTRNRWWNDGAFKEWMEEKS